MSLSALLPLGSLTPNSSASALLPLISSQSASNAPSQSASALPTASAQPAADTYTPSGGTLSGGAAGTIAADFNSAELDGVQLVQWMKDQATLSGSSQSDPSAVANSTSSGEALAAKFTSDLVALGSDLSQSTAGTTQSGAAASIEFALTQAIAASTDTNAGSGDYTLSISDSSLMQLASEGADQNAAASAAALKVQLTSSTPSGNSSSGASRSRLAVEYSTADVAASSGGTAVDAETSSFSTLSEMKSSSGVSVLVAELSSASVTADGSDGGSGANAGAELAANSSSFSMLSLQASGRDAAREASAVVRQWENAP